MPPKLYKKSFEDIPMVQQGFGWVPRLDVINCSLESNWLKKPISLFVIWTTFFVGPKNVSNTFKQVIVASNPRFVCLTNVLSSKIGCLSNLFWKCDSIPNGVK